MCILQRVIFTLVPEALYGGSKEQSEGEEKGSLIVTTEGSIIKYY